MRLLISMLLCASLIACSKKATEQPAKLECSDIRAKMITEQKAKISEKQIDPCKNDGKDYLTNPKSCFWQQQEKKRQKWIAEHPDPEQLRLNALEGKVTEAPKPEMQSAHEIACRIQIEDEIKGKL